MHTISFKGEPLCNTEVTKQKTSAGSPTLKLVSGESHFHNGEIDIQEAELRKQICDL